MEKNTVDTCFHIRMVVVSTCFYVGRVEKTSQPTPKQTMRNSLNPKRKRTQLPSCGVP
ncbi:MAG: hypothetical protein M1540_01095 [Candidatus Bathyarchaeota archaeon]|nr:hypothetical protein [Candidatus Bathyarchaeota archaeon]MCL5876392.1 hypothetical protein [Candidatus Bathyarchaeota archaeon]